MFERESKEFKENTKLDGGRYETVTVDGSLEFDDVDALTMTVNGNATGEDGTFVSLAVNGSLKAEDCTSEELTVNGPANLEDCKIKGLCSITGNVTAQDCQMGSLYTSAMSVVLDDCIINGDIMIRPDMGALGGEQELRLNGATIVKGSITFEDGSGVISKSSDAIVEGEISGADK